MSFIIEKISKENFDQSGLSQYSGKYADWKPGMKWIIDRERNYFVIDEGSVREEPQKNNYVYFFNGVFIWVCLELFWEGKVREHQDFTFGFYGIKNRQDESFYHQLRTNNQLVWAPLKEALTLRAMELSDGAGCTVNFTF